MLLSLGRVSLLAACTLFISVAAPSSWAQENESAGNEVATEEHAEGDHADGDHSDGDHADGDHADGDHADGDHAGGGHGHDKPPLLSIDVGAAVINLAIFLGVFAILGKFVWPVILNGLQAREQKIQGDLQAAEQANQEAKVLLADYQSKLDDAATQVQAMLAEARNDAESNKQKIVEEAKEEAERQRERAVADIETAKKVALSELAGQTSDMAISVAKQVVGRELKPEDHADLIRQALDRLPSNN
ncbi:MAG: F0F1 ATP synthase subunit B [Planctomycetota bacterium]